MHTARGREQASAERCRRLVDSAVLDACFVPRYERYAKRGGAWVLETDVLFREYFIVATSDVRALDQALSRMSDNLGLAPGGRGGGWASLTDAEREWLEGTLDDEGVIRASEGRIEDGALTVERGPLCGREQQIRKIDRHKRLAYVSVGEGAGAGGGEGVGGGGARLTLRAALNVPEKS